MIISMNSLDEAKADDIEKQIDENKTIWDEFEVK